MFAMSWSSIAFCNLCW